MQAQDSVIAIDVGGTQYRVALFSREGALVAIVKGQTNVKDGPLFTTRRIIASTRELLKEAGSPRILGIGAALAGPIHQNTELLHHPPSLPGWHRYNIKAALEESFQIPVYVDNDANLAVIGEHRFGAGQGLQHLVYITLSTGIGGGVIIGGMVLRGSRGFAGEIGHIIVEPRGPVCACGNTGCLEVMASGTAIARRAREELKDSPGSLLNDRALSRQITAKDVALAVRRGDKLARDIMEEVATYTAWGIVSLINVFDPEKVLIGGGVSRDYDLLNPILNTTVEERLMGHQKNRNLIQLCELGDEVSLYGAATLVFDQISIDT